MRAVTRTCSPFRKEMNRSVLSARSAGGRRVFVENNELNFAKMKNIILKSLRIYSSRLHIFKDRGIKMLTSSHPEEGDSAAPQLHSQQNLVHQRHHQHCKVKQVVVVPPVAQRLGIHLKMQE